MSQADASDVFARPVATASAISACAPGSLSIALGCLRIGGSVGASFAVASVPAWQTESSRPLPARVSAGRAILSQPNVMGRLSADVRMPTELGPVRAYVSLRNLPVRRFGEP